MPLTIAHFRDGDGEIDIQKFVDDRKLIAKLTLPSQASIGFHPHVQDDEVIYVLNGKGLCITDDDTFEIEKGCVQYTAMTHSHSIVNTGDEPLVLFAVISKYPIK